MNIKLYYFNNRGSRSKVVGIKQPDHSDIQFKVLDDSSDVYNNYYNRHRVSIEITGLNQGESQVSTMTFILNDGSEKTINIGNLTLNLREPSDYPNNVKTIANGSSNSNRDFAQFEIKRPLTLQKVNYKFSGIKENSFKIVLFKDKKLDFRDSGEISELTRELLNSDKIYDMETIENKNMNLSLQEGQTIILSSYFDFPENLKKQVYSFVDAEVVFTDSDQNKIIRSYHGEYVPYLTSKEIRNLSTSVH